jgi:hemerythrin-like domain-containing protein
MALAAASRPAAADNRPMPSISLPGLHTPGAGFDQPFDMLAACHDRVRRSLDLLSRLVEHVAAHGADAQARSAAADVLRYFTLAAPAHHEDEERHLIPRLLASPDAQAQATARRMLDDHAQIRACWAALQPLLQQLADGSLPALEALRAASARFVEIHTPHLALEDGFAFPTGRSLAEGEGPQAVAAMGREMAARRGQRNA